MISITWALIGNRVQTIGQLHGAELEPDLAFENCTAGFS